MILLNKVKHSLPGQTKQNMHQDTREIEKITFGIFSADEIKKMAVCKVDNPKLCNVDKGSAYGTVYDPRMGTVENGTNCDTCGNGVWDCPGHFGYIELNEPVIHPLYYKQVVSLLRCFCIKCFKLLITEDQIKLNNLHRSKGIKRFAKILEKLEKIDMCSHCSHPQPDIKHTISDNIISMVYKDKEKGKISIVLQVNEIKKIFDNINIHDVKLLGFDPDLVQPKNLILTMFPVIPTCCRPYVISENNVCDDDLTIQLVEIIKANNHLEQQDGIQLSDTKKQKHLQSLKFRISTFYNNSCLAPETPVFMWDGSIKRADEVEFGDELIGDDGEKRTVQAVCSGEDEMYEVINEFGESYTVNKNHYLTLKYPDHKDIVWLKPNEQHPLGCWLLKSFNSDVVQVEYIYNVVKEDKSKEAAMKEMQQLRDSIPYKEIFDVKISDYMELSAQVKSFLCGVRISKPILWESKSVMTDDPYLLGTELFNDDHLEKCIPDDIIYNDENTRMQLLAGITDSVGVITGFEIYIITKGKEKIMKQIDFIAKSLGIKSLLRTKDVDGEMHLETYISGRNIKNIPVKTKIKDFQMINSFYTMFECISDCVRIIVRPIGKGKYNGFIIDGNHRFLLGDFTVTHNSGKAKHSTNGRAIKGIKERLTGKEGLIRTNLMGKRLLITGECL